MRREELRAAAAAAPGTAAAVEAAADAQRARVGAAERTVAGALLSGLQAHHTAAVEAHERQMVRRGAGRGGEGGGLTRGGVWEVRV